MFAGSVLRLRAVKGWTQTDLARAMKDKGFAFHQQTIQRIEDEKRPVRLDEAYALAAVLEGDVGVMSRSEEDWRKREVSNALYGFSELTGALYHGKSQWFGVTRYMVAHVEHELDSGHRTDSVLAGLAIMHHIVRTIDEFNSTVNSTVEAYYAATEPYLSQSADEDVSMVFEDESRIRSLVKAHRLPQKFKSMTLLELAYIYAPGLAEDDGEH